MSRHIQELIFIGIVYSLSRIALDVLSITFVSKLCTLVLSVGRSYEFRQFIDVTFIFAIVSVVQWTLTLVF